MSNIVPIRGKFENCSAFLHHIANDESVTHFAIVTFDKEGDGHFAHFEMTRERLAYAALIIAERATRPYEGQNAAS